MRLVLLLNRLHIRLIVTRSTNEAMLIIEAEPLLYVMTISPGSTIDGKRG